MDTDDKTHDNRFDASLPLPDDAGPQKLSRDEDSKDLAADLIRRKVEAAYASEPNVAEEALDEAELGPQAKRSKHQQFIYKLTSSGQSLAEIQAAWHEYYLGLSDAEKHQVWQEFYDTHAQASRYAAARPVLAPEPKMKKPSKAAKVTPVQPAPAGPVGRTLAEVKDYVLGGTTRRKRLKPMQHLQSLLFGLAIGSIVLLIFLFSFFNERFIAPFIQPSRSVTSTPIINDSATVGPNPEIIIPKINVEIPVVYGVDTISEAAVETALEGGVVHYADTALPGQDGNLVIVGHSSNNIFNKGKYKFAFVLLSRLDNGDTFYLQKDGVRYTYQIYQKKIVSPTDISVLGSASKPATATLITCDPPGTSNNRLVVIGEQISPDPGGNTTQTTNNSLAVKSAVIPGNSPTLWSRLWSWLSH